MARPDCQSRGPEIHIFKGVLGPLNGKSGREIQPRLIQPPLLGPLRSMFRSLEAVWGPQNPQERQTFSRSYAQKNVVILQNNNLMFVEKCYFSSRGLWISKNQSINLRRHSLKGKNNCIRSGRVHALLISSFRCQNFFWFWEQKKSTKKKHENKHITGLSQDFGVDSVYAFFLIGNDPIKTHKLLFGTKRIGRGPWKGGLGCTGNESVPRREAKGILLD